MRSALLLLILVLSGCSESSSKQEVQKLEQEIENGKESKSLHLGPSPIDR